MAKTLELQFVTENGKVAKVSLDNPKEPIDPAVVKQSMDIMIAAGVFYSQNGNKSDRSHVVLWAKELTRDFVFLRPLGLRLIAIRNGKWESGKGESW